MDAAGVAVCGEGKTVRVEHCMRRPLPVSFPLTMTLSPSTEVWASWTDVCRAPKAFWSLIHRERLLQFPSLRVSKAQLAALIKEHYDGQFPLVFRSVETSGVASASTRRRPSRFSCSLRELTQSSSIADFGALLVKAGTSDLWATTMGTFGGLETWPAHIARDAQTAFFLLDQLFAYLVASGITTVATSGVQARIHACLSNDELEISTGFDVQGKWWITSRLIQSVP